MMKNSNLSFTLLVDALPQQVINDVLNVRAWWSDGITGNIQQIGDEFTYRYKDMHCSTQKLTELVPGQRAVWLITAANLSFLKHTDEWVGTCMVFTATTEGNKTRLVFTHEGLTAESECYEACTKGWGMYIESLRKLIITGTGQPYKTEAITA